MNQMTRARCQRCSHVHDLAALPLPVTDAVEAMIRACPMCGNRRGNTVAQARDLTEAEQVEKHHALALDASRRAARNTDPAQHGDTP
jgi:predicted  nucleic acid-binding Zn-ribbon protein